MDEKSDDLKSQKSRLSIAVVALFLVVGLALVLWLMNRGSNGKNNTLHAPSAAKTSGSEAVDALVSYSLPAGWSNVNCTTSPETVLVVPAGQTKPDCKSNQSDWLVTVTKDPDNTTDCNQLQNNNQEITKHTCSSLYINGHKSLKSLTEFNDNSTYTRPTRVSDYFINTGKGVVKVEYIDDLTIMADDVQAGFDQLSKSMVAK